MELSYVPRKRARYIDVHVRQYALDSKSASLLKLYESRCIFLFSYVAELKSTNYNNSERKIQFIRYLVLLAYICLYKYLSIKYISIDKLKVFNLYQLLN